LATCKTKQNKIETKQNQIEAKRNEVKEIKPKENVCTCAVAKLLLKVTVFCKSHKNRAEIAAGLHVRVEGAASARQ